MGISPFKNCFTNYSVKAPNPSPSHWTLLDKVEFINSYVLKVKYNNCTNFEGIKIMVYKGQYVPVKVLDPHFNNTENSPIARFKPDMKGWTLAMKLAESL